MTRAINFAPASLCVFAPLRENLFSRKGAKTQREARKLFCNEF
jgi:hypothetical protein